MAQVIDRQEVHDLVDQMPADRLRATISFLKLQAADDDEPVTEEDVQRYREAKAAFKTPKRWVSMEEVLADFELALGCAPVLSGLV